MLSIVIVNYRTWDLVARNTGALLASLPGDRGGGERGMEILVVDNGSDDRRRGDFRAGHPELRVIAADGNFGYAHGCNMGAAAARGDWLLFMNPDITCDWNNIAALWSAARDNPDWAILSAPQYSPRGRLQRAFGPFMSLPTYYGTVRGILRRVLPRSYPDPRTPPAKIEGILPVDWVSGSLMLMSRATFDRVGGWDEDYWLYHEDEDICRRAHDLGLRTGYFPGARFVHAHASSTRSSPETSVLTKSETRLSAYLYLHKHEPGLQGRVLRGLLQLETVVGLPFWTFLDTLSLHSWRLAAQQRGIHTRLRHYHLQRRLTGSTVSDRSIHSPARADR